MTIAENLDLLRSTKTNIKAAIEDKGVTVGDVPFSHYAEKIGEISGGGEGITEEQYTEGVDFSRISNNATYVRSAAFVAHQTLTEVNLPNCISVYGSAFQWCYSLSKVSLPACIYMGANTFYSCRSLTDIYCPNVVFGTSYLFYSCSNLKSISLDASVGSVYMFTGCSNLSVVSLPCISSALTSTMFSGCGKLSEVYMATETYIIPPYSSVFAHASLSAFRSSGTIYVAAENYDKYLTSTGWSSLSSRIVAYGDTTVPMLSVDADKRLYGRTKVLYKSFYTFTGTSDIQTVDLPNCKYILSEAFRSNSSIITVDLPKCVHVSYMAFGNASHLTYISLPECIYIGSYAFNSCSALSEVYLPACITIGYSCFQSCGKLRTVNLPKIESISHYTFSSCTSLYTVDLGAKCSFIGSNAFNGCYSLSSLYLRYPSVIVMSSGTTFMGTPNSGKFYVPESLVDAYKVAPYWSGYSNRITAIPE